jgi:hypothetical protein
LGWAGKLFGLDWELFTGVEPLIEEEDDDHSQRSADSWPAERVRFQGNQGDRASSQKDRHGQVFKGSECLGCHIGILASIARIVPGPLGSILAPYYLSRKAIFQERLSFKKGYLSRKAIFQGGYLGLDSQRSRPPNRCNPR